MGRPLYILSEHFKSGATRKAFIKSLLSCVIPTAVGAPATASGEICFCSCGSHTEPALSAVEGSDAFDFILNPARSYRNNMSSQDKHSLSILGAPFLARPLRKKWDLNRCHGTRNISQQTRCIFSAEGAPFFRAFCERAGGIGPMTNIPGWIIWQTC